MASVGLRRVLYTKGWLPRPVHFNDSYPIRKTKSLGRFSLTLSHFHMSKTKSLVRFSLIPSHFHMNKTKTLFRFSLTPSHFYMSKTKSLICFSLTSSHRRWGWEYVSGKDGELHVSHRRDRERETLIHSSPTLFALLDSFNMIGLCFWCPSSPGACRAVRHEGFCNRTVEEILLVVLF